MHRSVADKLLAARTALLWDHPFFAALAIQLEVVDATDDPDIDTMATDGKRLYVDGPFVESLKKDELVFVLAHEVMHNALQHHIRRQSRDPMLWNIAADYVINGELVETKVGTMPKCGLINARFTGMSAEEVYRILEEEGGGGGGTGSDPGGCGGVIDGCPQYDENAIAEARADIEQKVRQAAAIAKGMMAGTMPAGLKRLIDQLTRPKIDWRAVLRRFIDESITRDFSWAKPNRRFLHQNLVLPGTVANGLSRLTILFDTSGSVFDKKILTAFASEVNGAFGDGMIDRVTVVYVDTKVQRVEEFEAGDELLMQPQGGGGTVFAEAFEWIGNNAGDSSAVIVFTDMYIFDLPQCADPTCPVIWAVHGDSRQFEGLASQAPFGESVFISAA
jgi:predicted metal-dependent peptidase